MKYVVSIVEDSPSYQQALKRIIEESEEFVLGPVYGSAEEALRMQHQPPDIAVVDIQLPGMNGIELIRTLKPMLSSTQFLICSIHNDDEKIVQALQNGAVGYILKDSSVGKIRESLLEITRGGAPMSLYIARRVISYFQKPKVACESALLSDREREVLHLLSKGLQYKEIASHLHISYETVKKHLKNIYHKLHVQNKVEALNKFKNM